MKLTEIGQLTPKKFNRIMESRFGFAIDYANLDAAKAQKLISAFTESLDNIKRTHGIHTAEKNPRYMEILMVKESLSSWLKSNHRSLEESGEIVVESETAKSEAILAARDIVDSIQDMMERVGKMQNEQMPALLDAIRDQISMEQAEGFRSSVGPLLDTLAQTLQSSREQADGAARVLAGESVAQPMAMPGDEIGAVAELPAPEDQSDEFAATDAAAGGADDLGREKR